MPEQTTTTPAVEVAADNKIPATPSSDAKLVPESDLLAVKASKESLQQKFNSTVDEHKKAISTVTDRAVAAEAKLKDLEEKYNQASASVTELQSAKQQLETAQQAVKDFESKALEYRRGYIAATYNVSADTIASKNLEQLGYFEEALKSVKGSRGIGNYAVGGGSGGATAETPMERAGRLIKEAEERQGIVRTKEKETTKV